MTPRRRQQVKRLCFAFTAILVGFLPTLSLSQFVYLCGIVGAVIFLVLAGMFLEMWTGFRAFEAWTEGEARRRFGWKPAGRLARMVRR